MARSVPAPGLTNLRRSSLREDVVEALRAALITGRLEPGVVYSAPGLAEELGVSATPVREAMLELVRENTVEVVPNKGFRVRALSDRELDELVELRLLLEVPTMGAVAAGCEPTTAAALDKLRPLADRIERAAESGDLARYIQLDTEFHSAFLGLHGNASLVSCVRDLRGRSRLYGLARLAESGELVDTVREHTELIDLAIAQDRQGIEALTRRHIGRVRTDWAD